MYKLNPKLKRFYGRLGLAGLAALLIALSPNTQAQSTPAATEIEILGVGAESLLGYGASAENPTGPLTDPEWDGLDALEGATDPSWNWVSITSSIEPDFEGGENSFNIFDHKVGGGNDKWCCDDPTADNPVWVAVEFSKAASITHFTVASGNDSPDRDPTDWAIQGSQDGTSYTDIYHWTGNPAPWTERNQVAKFKLPSASLPYKFIRYICWETPGSLHQLNEIEYYGIVGGTITDSDGDGMPNDWESQYGFNPNDPSDAAKDANGNGWTNLQEFQKGTDPVITTKPTIVSVVSTGTFDTVRLTFSKALEAATATNLANYAISPSLAITAVAYQNKVVTLTTAKQTTGGTAYTVTVNNLKDLNNFTIAADTKATFYSYMLTKQSVLKISVWENITGTPVQNLYDDPRYPATPDRTGAVYSFNSRDYFPTDGLENYGATMEGFLTPSEAGDYRFFIYSDDASELYLSTDATEANLTMVAQETSCCNAFTEPDSPRTSEPIALKAGTKYFVRMVYKEGGGGDYGQVAWRKEGDTTPAGSLLPIPGKFLSSSVDSPYPADGIVLSQSPASGATGVLPTAPIKVVHMDGKTAWTSNNVSMKLDGVAVTPVIVKDGAEATVTLTPATLYPSASKHTVTLTYPDPSGQPSTLEWSFTVSSYPTLTKAQQALTVDKSKPGFLWRVFQNEAAQNTSVTSTEQALAGLLKATDGTPLPNLADPSLVGVALGAGTTKGNLVEFEIATVINLSQTEGENNGNFGLDNQMPGIPGLNFSSDGIDAEIISYVDLPAGLITMGVNSDDGFQSRVGYINVPADGLFLGEFNGGRGASDTLFSFLVQDAGIYPIRTIWQDGGGGGNCEIFAVINNVKVLLNDTAKGGYATYRIGTAPNKPVNFSIAVGITGGKVTVTWSEAGVILQESSDLKTWTDLASATSPYQPTVSGAMFYRLKK